MSLYFFRLFFLCFGDHRDLHDLTHSFPTRRSSELLNVHWDKAADGRPKPHAHVMLSMREVGPDGFGQKERDWNSKELLQELRVSWADHVNTRMAELDRKSTRLNSSH